MCMCSYISSSWEVGIPLNDLLILEGRFFHSPKGIACATVFSSHCWKVKHRGSCLRNQQVFKVSQRDFIKKKSECSDTFQPGRKNLKRIKHVGYSVRYCKIPIAAYLIYFGCSSLSNGISHLKTCMLCQKHLLPRLERLFLA